MTVRELLSVLATAPEGQPHGTAASGLEARCTSVTHDSRQVKPGSVFVALPGQKVDGVTFAPTAIAAGAVAVVA